MKLGGRVWYGSGASPAQGAEVCISFFHSEYVEMHNNNLILTRWGSSQNKVLPCKEGFLIPFNLNKVKLRANHNQISTCGEFWP